MRDGSAAAAKLIPFTVFLTLTGHAGPGADRDERQGRDPLAQPGHPQHQPGSAP